MNFYIVSIFPEIYQSFVDASLIQKAIKSKKLSFKFINPRDFTTDKHKQVDDVIYGGGKGMLIKAKPVIDAVLSCVKKLRSKNFKIVYLAPSVKTFDQQMAFEYSNLKNIIFVCGRYEGIDARFEQYFETNYPDNFEKISIGKFVLLGGEVASMVMIEAIARLVPGVIKEEESFMVESYNPLKNMNNIEFPQYTRPEEVYGMKVPEILLSGNHKKIDDWRKDSENHIQN